MEYNFTYPRFFQLDIKIQFIVDPMMSFSFLVY